MNDIQTTGIVLGVAVVLGGLAVLTGDAPTPDLDQFSDQGEPFYKDFTDPAAAASLEAIDYNEESGTASPFKVQVKDGVWSIPSHYDYLADGEDRLAKTAAGVIDLHKDVVQSDRLQDHEAMGVIDPLDDANPSLTGRGQRITLRDESGSVLADFIVGKPVEGRQGFRFVRLPDKKRTYAVKMEVDISTSFADWIETNLLDTTSADISRIQIQDYSIDEATGSVNSQGAFNLEKVDTTWTMLDLPAGMDLEAGIVTTMTTALADIRITGVRPKPAGLSADLRTTEGINLDMNTQMSLQSKGFFVSQDGRLLSNEGELNVGTKDGVRYTLRFGEVLIGEGMDVSAGTETDSTSAAETTEDAASSGGTENRYLFVTAQFDETLLPPRPVPPTPPAGPDPAPAPEADDAAEPPAQAGGEEAATEEETTDAATQDPPAENVEPDPAIAAAAQQAFDAALQQYQTDLLAWQAQATTGTERAAQLNERFSPWYYVISGSDFSSIRLGRDDLLKSLPATETPAPAVSAPGPVPPPGG